MPLGWSRYYKLHESDRRPRLARSDAWLAAARSGEGEHRTRGTLRTLVKQPMYGAVDSNFDQRVLDSFIDSLFTSESV